MAFIIRAVQETDLAEIVAIYNHEVTTGCATWNDQIYSVEDFKKSYSLFKKNKIPLL